MLPDANDSSESIVVLSDLCFGHLTHEAARTIKDKGHVLLCADLAEGALLESQAHLRVLVALCVEDHVVVLQERVPEDPVVDIVEVLAHDGEVACIAGLLQVLLIEQERFGWHAKVLPILVASQLDDKGLHFAYDVAAHRLEVAELVVCADQGLVRVDAFQILSKLEEVVLRS